MMKSNAIIDIVGDRPYVSFDIYDTLVIRPYVLPTDLFRHAERISGKEGFANARIIAEKDARKRHGREITLDEIYAEIDEKYREMIDLEKRMEIDLPLPNTEMKELLERLSEMGKRIVLISDMYLPVDVIGPMLKRCGIDRYERLYVSSESFRTKHNGSLYGQVMDDLNIEPKDLFHIGDNRHS
ncbi:MAG: HAD-IA family hydrolase, partial [Candidatus Methanomethylophilaceae archaeon]|nr:HAD-IA family hydrolase [Candidatus Methanomethylophilaceae archaeon]